MRHKSRVVLMAVGIAILGTPAFATLIPIGPFTGQISETWESFPNAFDPSFHYLSNPTSIFGGAASISNPVMGVYEPPGVTFGLGSSGSADVSDGSKGMGLNDTGQTAGITFSSPQWLFGGYWGAATGGFGPATVTVGFYDPSLVFMGNQSFTYLRPGDGVLEWHGWYSTQPFGKITYKGNFVVNDGLQAAVPEPMSVGLLGMGLLGVAGYLRRKRQ